MHHVKRLVEIKIGLKKKKNGRHIPTGRTKHACIDPLNYYKKPVPNSKAAAKNLIRSSFFNSAFSLGFLRGLVAELLWHSVHLQGMHHVLVSKFVSLILEVARMSNCLCKFLSEKTIKEPKPLMAICFLIKHN